MHSFAGARGSLGLINRDGDREVVLEGFYQFFRDPPRNLGGNGVSGSPSLFKVGRIQSESKPMIFSLSLPPNHLIPSVFLSDDIGTGQVDCGADTRQ